jgi:uncharacterized RDD family membrane protein YckC
MTTGEGLAAPRPRSAGLIRRLAAVVYESSLLAALALLLGFILLPLIGPAEAPPAGDRLALLTPAGRAMSFCCLFALCAAYCIWLWSGGRRPLPMKIWRLALVTTDGGAPSARRAALRYLAWWIGPASAIAAYLALSRDGHGRWALVLLGLNYAWALVDPDRQFLHDRIAGTRIVRSDAKGRAQRWSAR